MDRVQFLFIIRCFLSYYPHMFGLLPVSPPAPRFSSEYISYFIWVDFISMWLINDLDPCSNPLFGNKFSIESVVPFSLGVKSERIGNRVLKWIWLVDVGWWHWGKSTLIHIWKLSNNRKSFEVICVRTLKQLESFKLIFLPLAHCHWSRLLPEGRILRYILPLRI